MQCTRTHDAPRHVSDAPMHISRGASTHATRNTRSMPCTHATHGMHGTCTHSAPACTARHARMHTRTHSTHARHVYAQHGTARTRMHARTCMARTRTQRACLHARHGTYTHGMPSRGQSRWKRQHAKAKRTQKQELDRLGSSKVPLSMEPPHKCDGPPPPRGAKGEEREAYANPSGAPPLSPPPRRAAPRLVDLVGGWGGLRHAFSLSL